MMKKIDNKGFTLVELMATIVLLALIMGIGAYSITKVIQNAKDEDYKLLIENINGAVELYYQECHFVNDNCENPITLGFLVTNGYLKGNKTIKSDKIENVKVTLVNPNDDVDISNCKISYVYDAGKMKITAMDRPTDSCPTTDDYSK